MSMEEKRKLTRAERAATIGPLDRSSLSPFHYSPAELTRYARPPEEDVDKPLPIAAAASDKPLPEIIPRPLTDSLSNLTAVRDGETVEMEPRKALTDPRIFETIPAVPSPPPFPTRR